jgi:hypothetical protein
MVVLWSCREDGNDAQDPIPHINVYSDLDSRMQAIMVEANLCKTPRRLHRGGARVPGQEIEVELAEMRARGETMHLTPDLDYFVDRAVAVC